MKGILFDQRIWGVVLAVFLTGSGCFQTTTFRKGSATGPLQGGGSILNPPQDDTGALQVLGVDPNLNLFGVSDLTIVSGLSTGGAGSGSTSSAPVREVSGGICRFKIRKNDAQGTLLKTIDITDVSVSESDLLEVLRGTDNLSGVNDLSDTYQGRLASFFKMTGYQTTNALGAIYPDPGSYVNPVFKGARYFGSTSSTGWLSLPVAPPDKVLPAVGSSQVIVEVQGGDGATCGFDFHYNTMKDVRKNSGSAYRDLRQNIGAWMLANESGDLKLPVCMGASSGLGVSSGTSICQNGVLQSTSGSWDSYMIMRSVGSQGNRFLVNLMGSNLSADKLVFRFWGYDPGALFGTQWNPAATTSANRCDVLINTTSDSYTAGSGFPIGKTYKEMCKYSSWFWDTQH